jgi:hypothetical protein
MQDHAPPNLLKLLHLKRHCEQHGLNLNQLCVLITIEHQPKTHQQIAEDLAVTPAAMTSQIDTLVAKGRITSLQDPKDRRCRKVTLTALGLQILTQATHFYTAKTQTAAA